MVLGSVSNGKLRFVSFIVVAIVCLSVITVSLYRQEESSDPVKVGVVLPLTGPASFLVDIRDGMLLAVDEVNEDGGIGGRPLELIVRDSESSPEAGLAAFERIEARHKPVMYLSATSSVSNAIAPRAEEIGVPLMGLVVSMTGFTEGREWVFRFFPQASDEADVILGIMGTLEPENVCIAHIHDPYGLSITKAVRDGLVSDGVNVTEIPFEPDRTDFSDLLVDSGDYDVLVPVGYAGHVRGFCDHIHRTGYDGAVITTSSASTPDFWGDEAMDGVYLSAPNLYHPSNVFVKDVQEMFERAYGRDFTHYAAYGYDAIHILAGLMDKGDVSREDALEALDSAFVYTGTLGSVMKAHGEKEISVPLYPAVIEDGELVRFRK